MSKAKVTVVSYEEFTDIEFMAPANFYIKDAMGFYNYFHTRDRAVAQEWCNNIYGVGQYKVNASKISKSKGDNTCTGSETRRK